jgi:D-alanine-D-alanine ligase
VRVLVMMGGPSSEHDVSLASGRMVAQALAEAGYEAEALVVERSGTWRRLPPDRLEAHALRPYDLAVPDDARMAVAAGVREAAAADVVFIALHGTFGEDGTVQGMLETLGVPYTGSGPLASALAMHKHKAKELFRFYGLRVPQGVRVDAAEARASTDGTARRLVEALGLPLVVKPDRGGSSVGAGIAADVEALKAALESAARLDETVLVEERIAGREVTCAILDDEGGEPRALPLIEIVPRGQAFFDFESKYDPERGADEIVPARLDAVATRACQEAALTAHRALGCEGFSRVDMFWTEDGPVVLELNTIPGLTPGSLLPKAARAAGLDLSAVSARLVEAALRRHRRRHGGGDGHGVDTDRATS